MITIMINNFWPTIFNQTDARRKKNAVPLVLQKISTSVLPSSSKLNHFYVKKLGKDTINYTVMWRNIWTMW